MHVDRVQTLSPVHVRPDRIQNIVRQSDSRPVDAGFVLLQTSNEMPWFHFFVHTSHENKPDRSGFWPVHLYVLWTAVIDAETPVDVDQDQ